MSDSDFPPIYGAADRASTKGQRAFLSLNAARLATLLAIAVMSGVVSHVECVKAAVPLLLVFGWLLALGLSLALRIGRFDDKWFQCRAIAENVKRLAWQYASNVPIDDQSAEKDPERAFVNAVNQLRSRVETLAGALAAELQAGETITDWMRSSRQKSPQDRMNQYKTLRLQDQIDWYARKASFNGKQESGWFFVLLGAEILALAVAITQYAVGTAVNAAAVFVALSAGLVVWTQLKRFSDLASSYLVAAEDLRGFQAVFSNATPERLPELVERVEQAISREHRVWLTRRSR